MLPTTRGKGPGKKSLPSGSGVATFRPPCSVGYSSGQRGQTVNLLGSALHWFESSSYHHFTSLAGRARECQKGTKPARAGTSHAGKGSAANSVLPLRPLSTSR